MILGISYSELALLAGALLIAGAATGLLAGLFGVGGGTVIVPVLYELFRIMGVPDDVRMPLCVGTSLAVIIPTSIRSFRTHRAKGMADLSVLKMWAVPVVTGVIAGSIIARFAPPYVFKIVFVAVSVFSAFKLLTGWQWKVADDLPGAGVMRIFGLGIGLFSSLMGIGGGIFGNLIMMAYNRPIHQTVATSSGLGMLIAIPGALGYMAAGWPRMAELPPLSVGFVSLIGFALLIPTSTLFAPVGAHLAHRLPKRQLEMAFGVFLALVALRFLISLLA